MIVLSNLSLFHKKVIHLHNRSATMPPSALPVAVLVLIASVSPRAVDAGGGVPSSPKLKSVRER